MKARIIHSRLVAIVDELESKGLVERRAHESDRRDQQGLTRGVQSGISRLIGVSVEFREEGKSVETSLDAAR